MSDTHRSTMPFASLVVVVVSRNGNIPNLAGDLVTRGAGLVCETGRSDIAQARSIAMSRALHKGADWLFTLDDDVDAPLETFISHWSLAMLHPDPIAITGRYVSRLQPFAYAGRAVDLPPVVMLPEVECQRVVFGMGAMLQSRAALERLLPRLPLIEPRVGEKYWAAFATGPVQDKKGKWAWGPEDFTHCHYLESVGVPVVLAPASCSYEHAGKMPGIETLLYGDDEEPVHCPWVSEVTA